MLKHREYAESITASRDDVKVRKKSSVLGGQSVEYSDHFVPRSYISNDELWNLTPMRKSLNSSKNNKLPAWDEFFALFARYQFSLYGLIFHEKTAAQSELLVKKFNKYRRNNLNED